MSLSREPVEPDFCPHCGSPLPHEALFCRECGASYDAGWEDESPSDMWAEDDEFDYDDFVAREFGRLGPTAWGPLHYGVMALILVLVVSMLFLVR